ncbi:MAG: hypothetical protein QOE10_548 [Gaiellales bacterium]|nr:hypothetical protein [Gaiellales bacterium]
MRNRTFAHALAPLAALTAIAGAPAVAGAASSSTGAARIGTHALLKSRDLWATIDVCSPKDQPNTVGIRGSMPGDGRSSDRMYMSFRLQYMGAAGKWVDLASGATPGFVSVGAAGAAREGGRSFQLVPVAGRPASELRGVVDFQWRHGKTVLSRGSRSTGAGHKSVAGADPAGFSAASCLIG